MSSPVNDSASNKSARPAYVPLYRRAPARPKQGQASRSRSRSPAKKDVAEPTKSLKVESLIPATKIEDLTESDLTELKRQVYLTLKGSMSGIEMSHKLLRSPSVRKRPEVAVSTITEVCSNEKTYNRVYGIVSNQISRTDKHWQAALEQEFSRLYNSASEFSTAQLRQLGTLMGQWLAEDSIGWRSLSAIKLNAKESTPSNRILLQALLNELRSSRGIQQLAKKLASPELYEFTQYMLPTDQNPDGKDFACKFYKAIGLATLITEIQCSLP